MSRMAVIRVKPRVNYWVEAFNEGLRTGFAKAFERAMEEEEERRRRERIRELMEELVAKTQEDIIMGETPQFRLDDTVAELNISPIPTVKQKVKQAFDIDLSPFQKRITPQPIRSPAELDLTTPEELLRATPIIAEGASLGINILPIIRQAQELQAQQNLAEQQRLAQQQLQQAIMSLPISDELKQLLLISPESAKEVIKSVLQQRKPSIKTETIDLGDMVVFHVIKDGNIIQTKTYKKKSGKTNVKTVKTAEGVFLVEYDPIKQKIVNKIKLGNIPISDTERTLQELFERLTNPRPEEEKPSWIKRLWNKIFK